MVIDMVAFLEQTVSVSATCVDIITRPKWINWANKKKSNILIDK